MKLTSLEIFGFKSFPQRTSIRFDTGITGIVGPNGSGKSNIADAVRWVLGEQSAKALRGAKMEDVIFSGTQKRRLMPYCEVSLIFDNEDGALRSGFSEVMVTRRVYRTGESEYALNKRNCRLKDINELFYDTGIGREGYSIIGQGHIDVILSGRGEERRAAFEEAAGIISFRTRKEEAERKLSRTQEHMSRVSDLLDEMGSRLPSLQAQSEDARAFFTLSGRLKTMDANIFLSRRERLDKRIAQLQENMEGIAAIIRGHEAEIAGCQALRAKAEEDLRTSDERSDAAKAGLEGKEARLRELLIKAERGRQALAGVREEMSRGEETARELRQELLTLQAARSASARDGEEGESLLRGADARLALLEGEAEALGTSLTAAEEALETHRTNILKAANSRSDARERHARSQAMLAQAEQRLEEITNGRDALDEARRESEENKAEAETRLTETRAGVALLFSDVKGLEKVFMEKKAQSETANKTYLESQELLQGVKARLTAMQELADAHEGYGQPVRQALLRAGRDPRVHGVVAQLMQVPLELETALEMVLGGSLQHIVTEDEETAKQLIDWLRENRFGRTTFLPVSAVTPRALNVKEREVLRLPGCLGVASELIGFKPEHQRIFQSLLGRTVVAIDLDSAISIAREGRQAFHVVTLLGDVMRAGGAMTGGSSQRKTVSLLGREREIKELAALAAGHVDKALTGQAALKESVKEAGEAEDTLRQVREAAQEAEIGIAREEERAKQAAERLKTVQNQLDGSLAALSQLDGMIAELRLDLLETSEASSQSDSDSEVMREEEERLRAVFLSLRESSEEARQTLEAERAGRQALAHRLDLQSRDKARFERELSALEGKLQRLGQAREDLEEKAGRAENSLAEVLGEVKSAETLTESERQQARQIEIRRRELAAEQKKWMNAAEAAHERHALDSQRLHKGELSLTRLEEELQSMAVQLWNSHELTFALAVELKAGEPFDLPEAEREAADIRRQIKNLGAVNVHALEEYAGTKARFDEISAQRDDAKKALEDLIALIKRLQGQMEKQFVKELALLDGHFRETFKRLFSGGQASLSLADPSQPLDCDIQIKAQPPGKKLQLLSLLSGGERALTAIAILFAMLKLKPTPFCILDEIEAALDDVNIHSFADYLAEYAKGTQFIVITHRKGTMERCDALYGVTMKEKGVSDMISVNLQAYTA
jgi:chromosome segregation protein